MDYYLYKNLNPKQRLKYFLDTLTLTNQTPEYYVNWEKVVKNTEKYELELNTLNYLIGKKDIESEARHLFNNQPELLKTVPALIACRNKDLDVLQINGDDLNTVNLNFNDIDKYNIDGYIEFLTDCGLLNFLKNHAKKSLVDYVYGVESGIDSNARKNRSGTTMENILRSILTALSEELNYGYMEQATSANMLLKWNIDVPSDKSIRRYDGALYDSKREKVFVFETNYFNSGGSKLKAVAGEFQTLNELIHTGKDDVTFIWITDGQGWHSAKKPMEEAMGVIDNIYNLHMIDKNYLYETIS